MTNKEKAAGLMAVAQDQGRPAPERRAAILELEALRKSAKTSYAKLGVDEEALGEATAATIEDEPVPVDDALDEEPLPPDPVTDASTGVTDAMPAKHEPEVRGAISRRVRELLKGSDAPYADIQATVLAEFPGHARTTTRSIASVASEMRGKGEDVPIRRKPAKAK